MNDTLILYHEILSEMIERDIVITKELLEETLMFTKEIVNKQLAEVYIAEFIGRRKQK